MQVRELTWPQILMLLPPEGGNGESADDGLVHFSGADCEAQYGAWNEQRQLSR